MWRVASLNLVIDLLSDKRHEILKWQGGNMRFFYKGVLKMTKIIRGKIGIKPINNKNNSNNL